MSLEMLAEGWREKEQAFTDQAETLGMEHVEVTGDSGRGFLALTYSGSLVAVGPGRGYGEKSGICEHRPPKGCAFPSGNRRCDYRGAGEAWNGNQFQQRAGQEKLGRIPAGTSSRSLSP